VSEKKADSRIFVFSARKKYVTMRDSYSLAITIRVNKKTLVIMFMLQNIN